MNPLVKEIFVSGAIRHGAQALGGAVTASGVDLNLFNAAGVTVENWAAITAGVLVQLVAFGWSAARKALRASSSAVSSAG